MQSHPTHIRPKAASVLQNAVLCCSSDAHGTPSQKNTCQKQTTIPAQTTPNGHFTSSNEGDRGGWVGGRETDLTQYTNESAAEATYGMRSSVVVGDTRGTKDSSLARHLVTKSWASSGRRSTTTKPSAPNVTKAAAVCLGRTVVNCRVRADSGKKKKQQEAYEVVYDNATERAGHEETKMDTETHTELRENSEAETRSTMHIP